MKEEKKKFITVNVQHSAWVKRGVVMFSSGEQNFSYGGEKKEEMQVRLLIANWRGVKVEVSFHFFFVLKIVTTTTRTCMNSNVRLLILRVSKSTRD